MKIINQHSIDGMLRDRLCGHLTETHFSYYIDNRLKYSRNGPQLFGSIVNELWYELMNCIRDTI